MGLHALFLLVNVVQLDFSIPGWVLNSIKSHLKNAQSPAFQLSIFYYLLVVFKDAHLSSSS